MSILGNLAPKQPMTTGPNGERRPTSSVAVVVAAAEEIVSRHVVYPEPPVTRKSTRLPTQFRTDAVPEQHPFALRYRDVERVNWESCARVLDDDTRRRNLSRGWADRTSA